MAMENAVKAQTGNTSHCYFSNYKDKYHTPYLPSLQHWTELHSIKQKVSNFNLITDKIIEELYNTNDQQPPPLPTFQAQIPTSFKDKVNT